MWVDVALITVSGVGSMAVTLALVYSARQAKTLQAQLALQVEQAHHSVAAQRAANDLELMEQVMALDRLFIDSPELRPYVYDARELPSDDPDRARVISAAELIVDLADAVASMIRHGQLYEDDIDAWSIAMAGYGRSPAVRLVAEQGEGAWQSSTLNLLFSDAVGRHLVVEGLPPEKAPANGAGDPDLEPAGL